MKRNFVLTALFALSLMAVSASAQKAPDFSGTWTLDTAKSSPAEQMVESQTLVVTQTAEDIKVERTTKVKAEAAERMRGGGGNGDAPITYTLDGKAVDTEVPGRGGSMKISTKAKIDGGKLEITRSFTTPMGDRTATEKWWLNADGTLTVESGRQNREGGMETMTRIYKKS